MYFFRNKRDQIFFNAIKENPIRVKTSEIEYFLKVPHRRYKNKLLTKTGIPYKGNKLMNHLDWDLNIEKFSSNRTYISAIQVYEEGEKWENTPIYEKVIRNINAGKIMQESASKEELDNHFMETDILFNEVKKNGYKSQIELNSNSPNDEIRVAIGKNKEIIFLDGRHRLSIAKVLNIDVIPVFICIIHPEAFTDNPSEIIENIRVDS